MRTAGGSDPEERESGRGTTRLWENPVLWLIPAAAFALFITLRFPVYFHWDDVNYLRWAQTHPNPLDAFRPSGSTFFGTFRPALLLTWWALYRLFGLQAFGYQLVLTLLYASTFVLFVSLVRRLFNARAAGFALLGYLAVFFPLGYLIFWFSDLTFVQELFWMNLGLLLLVRAFQEPGRAYLWGVPCSVLAFLSKEPSVLVVTSCLALLAWSRWGELGPVARRRAAWLLPLVAFLGGAWILLSPGVQSREGISGISSMGEAARFIQARWNYYAGHLMAHAGALLWMGVFFLCGHSLLLRRRRPDPRLALLLAAVSVAAALFLRGHPGPALWALLAASLLSAIGRRETAIGTAWGFLPLFALLSIAFYIRTYLAEATFGFAILLGLAGDAFLGSFRLARRRGTIRLVQVGGAAAAIAAVILFSGLVREKISALQIISDNRMNFRDVTEYLRRSPPGPDAQVAVVTYRDMDLSYRYGVQHMADEEKGGLQKTMEPFDLPIWFRILGFGEVHVFPTLKDYLQEGTGSCYVWVMNNHEKRYLDGLDLPRTLLFEARRRGEGTWLYRVDRP